MSDTPIDFHMRGNYAPVSNETTEVGLKVVGELPKELSGLYVRNGPNPADGASDHWFAGDGMLHGIRLDEGNATWYRNRWIQTKPLKGIKSPLGADGSMDRTVVVANTNVIRHHGKILALVENGFPTEVCRELETVGIHDFSGKLTSAMTAHPKTCPVTGDLLFFGYHFMPPYLTYNRANDQGELVFSREIDVTGPTMIHDFAITNDYVIFLDLPVVFNLESAMAGTSMPYQWQEDYPARLGILSRANETNAVRWFNIKPCYVFHVMNAFDEDGKIVLDAARYAEVWREDSNDFGSAHLTRWTIDIASDSVSETQLSDLAIEFPRINDTHQGRSYRYGYAPVFGDQGEPGGLAKFDLNQSVSTFFQFDTDVVLGEFAFAANTGSNEDDGYLVGFAYRPETDTSGFYVFNAAEPESKPVAVVDLPQRVPFGFHGNWFPGG
jgi:carotenoid cleavage dioxygenase-like enzyme